jgi:predicted membrane-bound spermidine synthase
VLPTDKKPLIWFAIAEVLIGLVIAISVPLYPRLPFTFWQWKWLLRPNVESIGLFHLFQYGVIFSVMAVPTFLFGLTFPVAIKAASEERRDGSIASRAAIVYGWNTVGTLVGTLLAGVLLIPCLGLMRTLQIGAAINILIGLLILPIAPKTRKLLSLPAGLAVLALCLTPLWEQGTMTVGLYRHKEAPPASYEVFRQILGERKTAFYREDFGSTVAVVNSKADDGADQLTLIVDGKPDASSVSDMPTQVLLAQLPLLFKPDAKDVFVLGLGSGVTAGNVLAHPVQNVDCVELSPAVIDASRVFRTANHNPFADPRFHLYQDDGKSFLASVNRQYDVIISEPTNPWIAGVGGLFTRETFLAQKRKLRPGGIVAQWFHSYELDDRLVATILRTFREVFPHTLIFQGCVGDYIILGSDEAIQPDYRAIMRRIQVPGVAATLGAIGVSTIPSLLATQTQTDDGVQSLVDGGGINTDDFPQLEYLAPFAFYLGVPAKKIVSEDCRLKPDAGTLLNEYRKQFPLSRKDEWSIVNLLSDIRIRNVSLLTRVLLSFVERYPDDETAALAAIQDLRAMDRNQEALILAKKWTAKGNRMAQRYATDAGAALRDEEANGLIW